jgi:hypothetical protein
LPGRTTSSCPSAAMSRRVGCTSPCSRRRSPSLVPRRPTLSPRCCGGRHACGSRRAAGLPGRGSYARCLTAGGHGPPRVRGHSH